MGTEKWDLSSGNLSRSPRASKRGTLWKGVPGSYLVGLLVGVSYICLFEMDGFAMDVSATRKLNVRHVYYRGIRRKVKFYICHQKTHSAVR